MKATSVRLPVSFLLRDSIKHCQQSIDNFVITEAVFNTSDNDAEDFRIIARHTFVNGILTRTPVEPHDSCHRNDTFLNTKYSTLKESILAYLVDSKLNDRKQEFEEIFADINAVSAYKATWDTQTTKELFKNDFDKVQPVEIYASKNSKIAVDKDVFAVVRSENLPEFIGSKIKGYVINHYRVVSFEPDGNGYHVFALPLAQYAGDGTTVDAYPPSTFVGENGYKARLYRSYSSARNRIFEYISEYFKHVQNHQYMQRQIQSATLYNALNTLLTTIKSEKTFTYLHLPKIGSYLTLVKDSFGYRAPTAYRGQVLSVTPSHLVLKNINRLEATPEGILPIKEADKHAYNYGTYAIVENFADLRTHMIALFQDAISNTSMKSNDYVQMLERELSRWKNSAATSFLIPAKKYTATIPKTIAEKILNCSYKTPADAYELAQRAYNDKNAVLKKNKNGSYTLTSQSYYVARDAKMKKVQ